MSRCIPYLLFFGLAACLVGQQYPIDRGSASVTSLQGEASGEGRVAVVQDFGGEQIFKLPRGSLASEASLHSVSDDEICIDVTLRRGGLFAGNINQPAFASLSRWKLSLRGNGKKTSDGTVSLISLSKKIYAGQTTQARRINTTLECKQMDIKGQCRDSGWVHNIEVQHSDATFEISEGRSTACFVNDQIVDSDSRKLILALYAPGGSRPVMEFVWKVK